MKSSFLANSTIKRIAAGVCLTLLSATPSIASANIYEEGFENPTLGWRILQPEHDQKNSLDIVSFEWDYFMIHNHDGNFAGIVGYVLANPRGRLKNLIEIVPNGGNAAFVGEIRHETPVANYQNFGLKNTEFFATERYMKSENHETGEFALIEPTVVGSNAEPAMHLAGKTADWEWDLTVTQGMKDRDVLRTTEGAAFTLGTGDDVGIFKNELWSVDALWPRTNVKGSVKNRTTGEVVAIDGKGYRENSWGRYLLSIDGWDFLVFSEDDEDGVLMVMQTYHRSEDLDFLDISFYDENNELVAQRFTPKNNEFGWLHPDWSWDERSQQCVPQNTVLEAENDLYRIEANVEIGERQVPMLSNKTIGTRIYFIQEHFPRVSGVIKNVKTGEVVKHFEGQAGGEFSFTKKLLGGARSDVACKKWGDKRFSAPFPSRQTGE